jgi:thiol-disulfide isomerase/thioredoxin
MAFGARARWTALWAHLLRLRVAAPVALLGGAVAFLSVDAFAQFPGARAWLGVAMESPTEGAAGVPIGHVVRGSPGDRAGLRAGDRIVRVSTTPVSRGADVVRTIAGHAVGDSIDVVFVRGGTQQAVRATLAAYPSQDEMLRMDLVGTFAPPWRDTEAVSGAFPTSVASLRGRVVLLDFWATWCGPCRLVMPMLGALQSRFGAQGLSVVGVSAEDAQDVALFARRMAIPYPIAVDKHGETTRAYGVASLPTLVIVDKRGVVRDVSIGYDDGERARLEATVRSLLAEPPPAD